MEGEFDLFECTMKGQWDEVMKAYVRNPNIRETIITRTEDTALHIAASDGQTDMICKLVERLGENAENIFSIKNVKGNTPLHLAAGLGHVDICHCIASVYPSLLAARNKEGETPLFVAASQGKKEVFLCLHHFSREKEKDIHSRNYKGHTVLHAAIAGEHLKSAFQIIQCYPDLVNSVDENGLTPLHILASKPHVFKSSTRLRPLDRIIYNCIFVEKIKVEIYDHKAHPRHSETVTHHNYPPNWRTCISFFQLMMNFVRLIITKPQDEPNDEENIEPNDSRSESKTQPKKEITNTVTGLHRLYPPNYTTFALFVKMTAKAFLVILGVGIWQIKKIAKKKERHTWAYQIMNELVEGASLYKYESSGRNPTNSRTMKDPDPLSLGLPEESTPTEDDLSQRSDTNTEKQDQNGKGQSPNEAENMASVIHISDRKDAQPSLRKETPLLIAAQMGVAEIVEKILDKFPVAVHDLNSENKNLVLLAVENRQTSIYQLLLSRKMLGESMFRQVDNKGNSALHLTATLGDYRPWLIPGAALQMQWEIKWYKYVKNSMRPNFFASHNNKGRTAKEIFTYSHRDMVKEGREWLTKTSESCSVVAALIATVAYATSATVPGGMDENTGKPILREAVPFNIFAIASLVALCFSVTALVFFLSILTSRYQESDFAMDLPRKLLLGLTSLFTSIASMLISFCSGHFFIITEKLRPVAYPIYIITCLPMTIFALAQLPLYFDLFWAIFKKIPQRSYKILSCYAISDKNM